MRIYLPESYNTKDIKDELTCFRSTLMHYYNLSTLQYSFKNDTIFTHSKDDISKEIINDIKNFLVIVLNYIKSKNIRSDIIAIKEREHQYQIGYSHRERYKISHECNPYGWD